MQWDIALFLVTIRRDFSRTSSREEQTIYSIHLVTAQLSHAMPMDPALVSAMTDGTRMWSQLRRAIQLKVVRHVYDNFVAPASLNQGTGKGIIDHFAIWLGVPIGEELHARVRRHD